VVGSYPQADFTARSGRRLERALAAGGVEHDVRIYPGAKHSFFNDTLRAHDPAAAEDAWGRTLRFLDRHVAGSATEHE
jgi:carboxymethylenebutenolidase